MEWRVSSEVWFPALTLLVGIILSQLFTLLRDYKNHKREERDARRKWFRDDLRELQAVVNSVFWDMRILDIVRTRRNNGETEAQAIEDQRPIVESLKKANLLSSRIDDPDLRHLNKQLADVTGKAIGAKLSANEWHSLGEEFLGVANEFNSKVRDIERRL